MDAAQAADLKRSLVQTVKNQRACLRCKLILTKEQFEDEGCANCEEVLEMAGNAGAVLACTTSLFKGEMAFMRPDSFGARFTGLTRKKRMGLYAHHVRGEIPESYLQGRGVSEPVGGASEDGSKRRKVNEGDSASDREASIANSKTADILQLMDASADAGEDKVEMEAEGEEVAEEGTEADVCHAKEELPATPARMEETDEAVTSSDHAVKEITAGTSDAKEEVPRTAEEFQQSVKEDALETAGDGRTPGSGLEMKEEEDEAMF
mmetsp:Transcript_22023/g.50307  ORF Transcript_22023/g.50307 Transcript_22023/m.50307 type:complete len:264 (-) Transcript_22023:94-885(-)